MIGIMVVNLWQIEFLSQNSLKNQNFEFYLSKKQQSNSKYCLLD
jgi:hypothetical protein